MEKKNKQTNQQQQQQKKHRSKNFRIMKGNIAVSEITLSEV